MKRFVIFLVLAMATVAAAITGVYQYTTGARMVQPGQLHTERSTWTVLLATASAGDEPNDLAVAERTYATVIAAAEGGDSKIGVLDLRTPVIRQSWNKLRLRCIGISDGNSIVYQIYTGTLGVGGTDCALVKSAQLAFTIGTQASETATYEYADTLTITEYCTSLSWLANSPLNNLVAEGYIDLAGDDYLVIVPTTVNCNCKLLVKGF